MDVIGDFITIIRNASAAHKLSCSAQWSNIREGITKILLDEGFIADYKVEKNEKGFKVIVIALKYVNEMPAINKLKRESNPGRRLYYGYEEIPRVLSGLGFAILSTSKGIMHDKEARNQKVGGEHLCSIW